MVKTRTTTSDIAAFFTRWLTLIGNLPAIQQANGFHTMLDFKNFNLQVMALSFGLS